MRQVADVIINATKPTGKNSAHLHLMGTKRKAYAI